jgi:hypothetical protein
MTLYRKTPSIITDIRITLICMTLGRINLSRMTLKMTLKMTLRRKIQLDRQSAEGHSAKYYSTE